MEQGRVFLAISLSLIVFLAWDFFFVDRDAIQQQAQQQQAIEQRSVDKPISPTPAQTPLPAETAQNQQIVQTGQQSQDNTTPARKITVETPLYIAELSEQGGNIIGFTLKKYREAVAADAPFKQLMSKENTFGTIRLNLTESRDPVAETGKYQSDAATENLTVNQGARSLTFTQKTVDGIFIQKIYSFSPDTYLVDFKVTLSNQSELPLSQQPAISLVKYDADDNAGYGFTGPSGYIDDNLKQIKKKKIADQNTFPGTIKWVGVQDRYFLAGIMPTVQENHTMRLATEEPGLIRNQLVAPATTINPGAMQSYEYQLFFGPKSLKLLRQYGNDLHKAVYFGFFDILAKPCLWVMNFIHDNLIANYGIAIILLTLLTKIILWPLGQKSYKSMAEMKKIQPLMTEIREKYKNDKKKMNEEVMALYRAYKVNPMGGCLPMVVQIPVFFALYRMLYEAIELRHAPFFGWINDLSAPDRLFDLGVSIPFMQPPYGIPVLTLVMGASMFLQQKLQPAMGDPTQAKLMMLMPIFFTFIFINFSSGLVLYWLVNNVFSIAQQYVIQGKKK